MEIIKISLCLYSTLLYQSHDIIYGKLIFNNDKSVLVEVSTGVNVQETQKFVWNEEHAKKNGMVYSLLSADLGYVNNNNKPLEECFE